MLTTGDRLFRHDGLIAINTLRATFAGWHDRLLAGGMLLFALAALRADVTVRPWPVAAWAAVGVGTLAGLGAARTVSARLHRHAFDGLLAADALQPATRRRYAVAWHVIAAATLACVALVARPSLIAVALPGYLAGVLAATVTSGVRWPAIIAGRARPSRAMAAWLHRPSAGVASALLLLASLAPTASLGQNAALALLGIGSALLAGALTRVDAATVAFMAVAGHGPWRIAAHHGRSLAVFALIVAPVSWLALGHLAGAVAAGVVAAMALLLALRVAGYLLHSRRFADLLVSLLAGLLIVVGYTLPVVLPLAAGATLWQLQRRARAMTWLLA